MEELREQIQALKKEKDAVILAHYYVDGAVQQVADYVGDSYYLSKTAAMVPQQTIVFAGVAFMGESAKILSPKKTVLLPEPEADCPMAHMADIKKIEAAREKYEDLAVVCYINSTAELKSYADVCVTSANAMKIVKKLPNHYIYFIPDEHLGSYIAARVPEKEFILNDGFCPVHKRITQQDVERAKAKHTGAKLLVHPECTKEVVEMADYTGSTTEIISYAAADAGLEYLIGTESGVMYALKEECPQKKFYEIVAGQCCEDMKKVTLEKVRDCLKNGSGEVRVEENLRQKSLISLDRMLQLAE